jgi:hypothetical protein
VKLEVDACFTPLPPVFVALLKNAPLIVLMSMGVETTAEADMEAEERREGGCGSRVVSPMLVEFFLGGLLVVVVGVTE